MAITRPAPPQPSSCSTGPGDWCLLPTEAGRTGTGLGRGHREGKTEGNDSAGHPGYKPGPGDAWSRATCPHASVPRSQLRSHGAAQAPLWTGFGKASPSPPGCCGLQAPAITENRCAPSLARDRVTSKLCPERSHLLKAEAGCAEARGLGGRGAFLCAAHTPNARSASLTQTKRRRCIRRVW